MCPLMFNCLNPFLANVNFTSMEIPENLPAITCSKLTIKTLEQGVEYAQS